MYENMEGYEVFGVNTGDLHYKPEIIRMTAELAQEANEPAENCKYYFEDDMLEHEVKGEADFYEVTANDTLFGIAPIYPFNEAFGFQNNWQTFKNSDAAAAYIGILLEPLVEENAEEIAKKCKYIHCIREC